MSGPMFKTAKQRHIAALLGNGPLSLWELLEVVGGDKTTLKRGLERLEGRGLVAYVASDAGPPAPGNPAGLWSLTTLGEAAAPNRTISLGVADDEDLSTGLIEPGQTLVTCVAPPHALGDVLAALVDGELTAAAAWIARIDGHGWGYLFAFEAALGSQPADNLRAGLEAVGASCSLASVRGVQKPRAFVGSLRTARSAARRSAARQDHA